MVHKLILSGDMHFWQGPMQLVVDMSYIVVALQ